MGTPPTPGPRFGPLQRGVRVSTGGTPPADQIMDTPPTPLIKRSPVESVALLFRLGEEGVTSDLYDA
eukprot:6827225-Pyramimonas_sp.AAC.1